MHQAQINLIPSLFIARETLNWCLQLRYLCNNVHIVVDFYWYEFLKYYHIRKYY